MSNKNPNSNSKCTKVISNSNRISNLLSAKFGNSHRIPFQKELSSDLMSKWDSYDPYEKRLRSLIMIMYGYNFQIEHICEPLTVNEFKFGNKSMYMITFGTVNGTNCYLFSISYSEAWFIMNHRTKKLKDTDAIYINEYIETRSKYIKGEGKIVESQINRTVQ